MFPRGTAEGMCESMKSSVADLLYAAPNAQADMRWLTRFSAVDPILALRIGKKVIGVVPLLEVARAAKEGRFSKVLNLTEILTELRQGGRDAGIAEVIAHLAQQYKVTAFRVPDAFPAGLADRCRALGLTITPAPTPFFPERVVKTDEELDFIRAGNKASCAGFKAVERILAESEIKRGFVHHEGKTLTSEKLHAAIHRACLDAGGLNTEGLIAAAGLQGVDCHCHGHGPIRANGLIVVDIFPKMMATGYCGDMTRTYLKGEASPEQRRMVKAVKDAHTKAIALVKAGVTGAKVHGAVVEHFEKLGYKAGREQGLYTGFFHGTGHGLGLDVHEEPSVSLRGSGANPLKPGMVITIEPGLYYPSVGGCRIEDVVVVTKTGCELLSKHPYRWEIA